MKIAIVGAGGDLGKQLLTRVLLKHEKKDLVVLERDSRKHKFIKELTGEITLSKTGNRIHNDVDIVHCCVNASHIDSDLVNRFPRALFVLHDSVMNLSVTAGKSIGMACTVHMLMNKAEVVVVDKDNPHAEMVAKHFENLDFKTEMMHTDEHDLMMAKSQALVALFSECLQKELAGFSQRNLLTPSGEDLLSLFNKRSINWTKNTMDSLLRNPSLEEVITILKETIKEN